MAKRKMAEIRTVFRCSSSIANFHDKLKNYLELEDWHWWKNRNDQVIFFGLYHWKDYLRFLWHKGPKKVFWCGSDILALSDFWANVLTYPKAKHYVENEVEFEKLLEKGIESEIQIRPMIFDDPDKYQITYQKPESKALVFASGRLGREKEYGLEILKQIGQSLKDDVQFIFFGGDYPSNQYDQDIKGYHACLRVNEFDGFSEAVAKSVLLGQYPITRIKYPKIDQYEYTDDLVELLRNLKNKKEPNYEASKYWRIALTENYEEVRNNWYATTR